MPAAATPLTSPYDTPRAARLEARRRAALAAARAAAGVAARFGARLLVFGSLAGEGRFHRASDLDLALEGPLDALDRAAAEVFHEVARHGFDCDMVRLDLAPSGLKRRILAHGREPGALV